MSPEASINDITIRTDLRSGDLGYVVYLHGILYKREYDYRLAFESYVAAGLSEFYKDYEPDRNSNQKGRTYLASPLSAESQ
jgi:peptidyl-dipeptidase Dcp